MLKLSLFEQSDFLVDYFKKSLKKLSKTCIQSFKTQFYFYIVKQLKYKTIIQFPMME